MRGDNFPHLHDFTHLQDRVRNKDLETVRCFSWSKTSESLDLKGLGWAQFLEYLTAVIRMKGFDKRKD